MFSKGNKVRLNKLVLDSLYPYSQRLRNTARKKIFIVIGYSRDKQCTRVAIEGHTGQSSYHNSFLQKVK